MKKIISIVLVLVCTLCMFTGCKPKIEDTEDYKLVCVTAQRMEQEELQLFSRDTSFASKYEVTYAQFIKKVEVESDFTVVMQTEDGKYHVVDLANLISTESEYNSYFVITETYARKNRVTDHPLIFLTQKTAQNLMAQLKARAGE